MAQDSKYARSGYCFQLWWTEPKRVAAWVQVGPVFDTASGARGLQEKAAADPLTMKMEGRIIYFKELL